MFLRPLEENHVGGCLLVDCLKTDDTRCLRGIEYTTLPLLRGQVPHHVKSAFNDYKQCRRRPREHRWVEWDSGCQRFHVTYFNIQRARTTSTERETSCWRRGPLHSSKDSEIICESAYTVGDPNEPRKPLSDEHRLYLSRSLSVARSLYVTIGLYLTLELITFQLQIQMS